MEFSVEHANQVDEIIWSVVITRYTLQLLRRSHPASDVGTEFG
jgi:hypothetical protein